MAEGSFKDRRDMRMETEQQQMHHRGVAAMLAATLLWATTFVMMKSAFQDVPVLWVIALRFLGAAILLAVVGAKRLRRLDKGTVIGGMKMGVLLFVAYLLQNLGLVTIAPGKNAFLLTGYTVITPFVAWAWDRKKPDAIHLLAAAVCFTGMGLASFHGDATIGQGEILTITSGLFYALHIVCSSRETRDREVLLVSLVQMTPIAVISLVLAVCFAEFPTDAPPYTWWNIAYLSLVCTGVCFLLQTYGQKYTPAVEVSIILPFESVFGALFSVMLGEQIIAREVAGYTLMFLAALLSQVRPGKKEAKE